MRRAQGAGLRHQVSSTQAAVSKGALACCTGCVHRLSFRTGVTCCWWSYQPATGGATATTRQIVGVGHRAQSRWWCRCSPQQRPETPQTPLTCFLFMSLLYRSVARSASNCHTHRTAAVPLLGARRLLPHQRQSRKALHVVNYVTEHAPVAYKDLSVGECGQTSDAWHAVQMLQLQQLAAVQLPHEPTMLCSLCNRCSQGG
jgi:hypothetical protein